MGKDFRVGMITGVVLAGAALVWVATRPSLSLRARMPQIAQPPAESRQTAQTPLPWENAAEGDAEANRPQTTAREPARPQDVVQQVQNSVPASPASTPVTAAAAATNPSPVVASLATPPATGAAQQDLTIYETRDPIKTTRFHIVRKGENLSSIAQQYYGSSNQWRKIVAANAKTVKDPGKIAPGTKLIIPD
jgi:nucleoid-associated protein YgaU